MLIGEMLVKLGLITQKQLEDSLELQSLAGGRLGQVIAEQGYCSQQKVDQVWAESVVIPALKRAVERALGGDADSGLNSDLRLISLSKRTLVQEDLLNGCAKTELPMGIEGLAEVAFDGRAWVPFQFVFLAKCEIAYLDSESAVTLKNWARSSRREIAPAADCREAPRVVAAAA